MGELNLLPLPLFLVLILLQRCFKITNTGDMTTSIMKLKSRDKVLLETSWTGQHDRRTGGFLSRDSTIKVCTYLLSDQCEGKVISICPRRFPHKQQIRDVVNAIPRQILCDIKPSDLCFSPLIVRHGQVNMF